MSLSGALNGMIISQQIILTIILTYFNETSKES